MLKEAKILLPVFFAVGWRCGLGKRGREFSLRPDPPVHVSRRRDLLCHDSQSGRREQPQGACCVFLCVRPLIFFLHILKKLPVAKKSTLFTLAVPPRHTTRFRTPKRTAPRRRSTPSTPPSSANSRSRTCTSQCNAPPMCVYL